jgi:hypothetical protein
MSKASLRFDVVALLFVAQRCKRPDVVIRTRLLTQLATLQITFFDEAEGIFEDRCERMIVQMPETSNWVIGLQWCDWVL